MNHWRVLLDLDGTIARNAGRIVAARHFGITFSEEQAAERLVNLLGLTEAEFWKWWHENQEEIYDQAIPLAGAAEVLRQLREDGAHITVVTARRPEARTVTARWLDRYNFVCDEMVFGADDKVAVARERGLTLGFEDDPGNAAALAEVMPMVLIDHARNRTPETAHPHVHRVGGWSEVQPLLRRLAARTA